MIRSKVYNYNVTCVIMGGGAGSRLKPLTLQRAKPAVPLGAKYRLIDIPLSNCLNSGLNRIYILTQFNSTSLHRHISMSYHFDRFSKGFVEILAAQQSPLYQVEHAWYEGTADAVRKNLGRFADTECDEVLILSGDQIYRMDFQDILGRHRGLDGSGPSGVTIAGLLVPKERARSFGIMRIGLDGDVLQFVEKPGKNDSLFEGLEAPPELLDRVGVRNVSEPLYLANMGIYVFGMKELKAALDNQYADFGKEILPGLLGNFKVRAHLFDGYWEDIGTIRAFHQANIELASANPRFEFYSEDTPIYTRARLLPATKIRRATVTSSLIADGCMVDQAVIEGSLIGVRSIIGKGCTIKNTYVMGMDYYETDAEKAAPGFAGAPSTGIGDGTHIENAIIDKNARIGRNVVIRNREELATYDDGMVEIREGIVVVPRGAVIPDGYTI